MLPLLLIFSLGLAIGSFINALIYRLQTKKSWLWGHSICPHCQHRLAWYDLIPIISFLLLKARCRYCHKKISPEYPLVELAAGILFIIVYLSFNVPVTSYQLLVTIFITAILIIIFIYDLKYYLIPDKIILPAIVIVFIANFVLGKSWSNMLIAAAVPSVFFLAQFLISKGKWLGAGDLRLGFFMGVVLGWPNILVALFLAYIFGSVIGLLLIIFKAKKWNSKIPFAAFLCPATFITMLWGSQLLQWYLKIF